MITGRSISRLAAVTALVAASILGGGVAANAAPPAGYIVQYSVINKSTLSTNYTNLSNELARCNAASAGITCSISKTTSASRSISLSLGITRAAVASGLGISADTSQSIGVSCTSPALQAGQSLRAYPVGTRYSYQVQKRTYIGASVTVENSGTLYAFNPRANSFTCKIV